jgi:hypothetical protein
VLGLNLVGSLYFVHRVLTMGNSLEVVADGAAGLDRLAGGAQRCRLRLAAVPGGTAAGSPRWRRRSPGCGCAACTSDQTQLINEWGEVVAARD